MSSLKVIAIVSLPIALGAAVSQDTPSPYTKLSVQGTGYGSQDAEYLLINAEHHVFSRSAGTAIRQNASALDRLRATLLSNGIAKEDFRTASFTFREGHDPEDHSSNPARGFDAEQDLTVVVRNVVRAGDVIDALVAAGAKGVSVGRGYGYATRPASTDLTAARVAAINDARSKAEDYARALGLKIRRVVEVRDQSSYSIDGPPPAAMRVDAATQIDTPKSTLVYSVGVEFELER